MFIVVLCPNVPDDLEHPSDWPQLQIILNNEYVANRGSNELNPGPLTVSLHDLTNFLWIDESVLQIGKHQLVRLRDIEPKSPASLPLDFLPHFEHIHRAGIH